MSDDQWRNELDSRLANLSDAANEVFKAWMETPAEQPEALLAAARAINSAAVTAACQDKISALESWLCDQHNETVMASARKSSVPFRSSWRMLPDGCLYKQAQPDVRTLAHDSAKAREACVALAEFIDSKSGVMGAAKLFLIGALNPAEGFAALFGESSFDEEGRRLNSAVEAAVGDADYHLTALLHAVDTAVVSTWNTKTVGALTAIEEEAERRNIPVPLNSRGQPMEEYPSSNTRGRWVLGIGLIVVLGLVVVLGLGGWGAYAVFSRLDAADGAETAPMNAVEQGRLGVLEPGGIWAGPGDSFDTVTPIDKATATHLLDDSVPGWLKVRLADGREGWVPAERFSE